MHAPAVRPAPGAAPAPAAVPAEIPWGRAFLLGIAAVAGAWAHAPLLLAPGRPGLAADAERWVFDAGATPPGLLVLLAGGLAVRTWRRVEGGRPSASERLGAAVLIATSLALAAWSALIVAPDLLALSLWSAGLGWTLGLRGRRCLVAMSWSLAPVLFALTLPAPLRNALVDLLQQGMARTVGWLLAGAGFGFERSGELLRRGPDQFAVIETCAGLRSIECLTLVAVLSVGLRDRRGGRAWGLVLAAPLLALAINAIRMAISILAPARAQEAWAHAGLAVLALLLGVLALQLLDTRLARRAPARAVPRPDPSAAPWPAGWLCGWALALVVLGQGLAGSEPPRWPLLPLSAASLGDFGFGGEADSQPLADDPIQQGSIGLHQWLHRRYRDSRGIPIDLWISVGDPRQRATSPLSPRLERPQLAFETREQGRLSLGDGEPVLAWRLGSQGGRSWLVASRWYDAGGLAHESLRAFLGVDRAPWARRVPVVFVRVATPADDDGEGRVGAEQRIRAFWRDLEPRLAALRAVGRERMGAGVSRKSAPTSPSSAENSRRPGPRPGV